MQQRSCLLKSMTKLGTDASRKPDFDNGTEYSVIMVPLGVIYQIRQKTNSCLKEFRGIMRKQNKNVI